LLPLLSFSVKMTALPSGLGLREGSETARVEAAQVLGARARTGNIAEEIAVDFAASLTEGNSRL
jgi:hypothetical protein